MIGIEIHGGLEALHCVIVLHVFHVYPALRHQQPHQIRGTMIQRGLGSRGIFASRLDFSVTRFGESAKQITLQQECLLSKHRSSLPL